MALNAIVLLGVRLSYFLDDDIMWWGGRLPS